MGGDTNPYTTPLELGLTRLAFLILYRVLNMLLLLCYVTTFNVYQCVDVTNYRPIEPIPPHEVNEYVKREAEANATPSPAPTPTPPTVPTYPHY